MCSRNRRSSTSWSRRLRVTRGVRRRGTSRIASRVKRRSRGPTVRRRDGLAVITAALAIVACAASDTPNAPPAKAAASIDVIDGDGQRGFVGEQLANPVQVRIVDSSAQAIQGKRRIRFSVAEGSGSVSDTTVISDERGRASVRWVLGNTAGQQ